MNWPRYGICRTAKRHVSQWPTPRAIDCCRCRLSAIGCGKIESAELVLILEQNLPIGKHEHIEFEIVGGNEISPDDGRSRDIAVPNAHLARVPV